MCCLEAHLRIILAAALQNFLEIVLNSILQSHDKFPPKIEFTVDGCRMVDSPFIFFVSAGSHPIGMRQRFAVLLEYNPEVVLDCVLDIALHTNIPPYCIHGSTACELSLYEACKVGVWFASLEV